MFFSIVLGTVFVPAFSAYAQANVDTSDYNDYEARLQDCGVLGDSNLTACLVEALYYLVLTPSAWFARVTGELFDYFVQYSLDTNSYRGNDNFIERGWSIVRDIGNVLFIFALLYIAITHILQAGTSGTKKFLINLIIAALLINFSLFFSRVIIDGGNVLARAFYNNIEIPNDDNLQYHTISQGIVMHVNPQRLLGSELFTPKYSSDPDVPEGKVDNGYAALILGMATAVNIVMGITFLSVALLFVGRVVGLWFLMIFSPFALASIAVPNSGKIFGQFSWSGWIDQILKLSFMAPVFLFFLFLLIMFLQIIFQTNVSDADKTTVQWILDVVIPFVMVIFILNKAKKVAADMAGEAGSAVKSAVGSAAGFAVSTVGLGIGATAYIGRNTVGRLASSSIKRQQFQERVALNNMKAKESERKAEQATNEKERLAHIRDAEKARAAAVRNAMVVNRMDKFRKGSWDIRKTDWMKKQGGLAGVAYDVGAKAGGWSKSLAGELFDSKTKLDIGKAKDTSRSKYEEDQKKKDLEKAKLYDVQDRGDLEMIKYEARKGLNGKTEAIERIDEYIEETTNSKKITETERERRLKDAENWKKALVAAVTDKDVIDVISGKKAQEIDNPAYQDLKESLEEKQTRRNELQAIKKREGRLLPEEERELNGLDGEIAATNLELKKTKQKIADPDNPGYSGVEDHAKTIAGQARDGYATIVENKNITNDIFNLGVGKREAAARADEIRRGVKPDDWKDKFKKLAKEVGMDEKPKDEPKSDDGGGDKK